MTHSIPDAMRASRSRTRARARCWSPATTSSTRRPVDGAPGRHRAPGRARPRGRAAAVRRLDQRRPPGLLAVASRSSARTWRSVFAPLRGPHRRHLLRVEHPPRPAGRRRRRGARPQGRARRPLDAQERQHRRARSGTSTSPRACSSQPREIDDFPDDKLVDHLDRAPRASRCQRAAPHGPPRPPAGRAARRRHGRLLAPRRSRATSARSTRRSTGSTTSAATSSRPRDAPIHASGHGYAEEIKLMLNLTQAALRDAVPRRLQAHPPARRAGRGGRRRRASTSSRARTACRWRSTRDGARFGEPRAAPG